MAASKPALFSYFRSSCAWRIRLVLAVKEIEYDYKPVNLLKKEQTSEPYMTVNPSAQVPSFLVEGHTLTQSVSIFEYLEEKYPTKPLLPKDIFKKAKVRELAEVISSGIQPVQNLSVLQKLPEDQRKQWAHDAIAKGFKAFETLLKNCSGRYCVGDTLTWADCCLIPQIFNANRFNVDMKQYPNINRIGEALSQLPEFKAAHPTQQPDCPDDLK